MRFTQKLLTCVCLSQYVLAISCVDYNVNFGIFTKESDDIVTCIENVARKYFPCGSLVTIINQNKSIDRLVQAITNKNCYSIVIKSPHDRRWLVPTEAYVIMSEDVTELLSIVSHLSKDILWNPRGMFLVHIQQLKQGEVSNVFKICARYKVFNILLLIQSDDNKTVMFTYSPFGNGKCGDNIEPVRLGNCEGINSTTITFSHNKQYKLQNCKLRVTAAEDIPNFIFDSSNFKVNGQPVVGLEQYVLQTIQAREGITIVYKLISDFEYGIVLPNGTATKLLRFIQDDEADIAGGGFILIKNRIEMFDFILGINYASFSVFTPNIGEPAWKDVYREFGVTTWISILSTFCLITMICFKIQTSIPISLRDRNVFLGLWGYLCGNASNKLPKEKKLKLIVICWIWFAFFITNFYNTALYSLITRRAQVKRHMNPENLAELPFQPCITVPNREFFLYAYNKNLPEGEDYPECHSLDTVLNFITSRNDLYTIEMDYTYILHEFNYVNEEGIPKLDSSDFSNNIFMGFYVARGFFFTDKIQEYVYRMQENGLLTKQLDMILQQGKSQSLRRMRRFKKIGLSNFRIHYALLLLGSITSFICLILEIKMRKRDISSNYRSE